LNLVFAKRISRVPVRIVNAECLDQELSTWRCIFIIQVAFAIGYTEG
jgi:hypothetical protein